MDKEQQELVEELRLTEEECDQRAILTFDSVNNLTPYQAWAFGITEGGQLQLNKVLTNKRICWMKEETCPECMGEGNHTWNPIKYDFPITRCETCNGTGKVYSCQPFEVKE